MFNLLQSVNDDQTAIGACILALAGAALFVAASFHLGPAGQRLRNRERLNSQSRIPSQSPIELERSHERAA